MKRIASIGLAVLGMAIVSTPVSAAPVNLVADGSFETGNHPPDGWGVPGSNSNATRTNAAGFAEAGTYGVGLSLTSSMFQNLSTSAGHAYDLYFWYRGPVNATSTNNELEVFWGTSLTPVFDIKNIAGATPFIKYETFIPATSSSTQLKFVWTTASAHTLALDNVSVTDTGRLVPLPAAMWSGLALLGGLAIIRRVKLGRASGRMPV